MYCTFCIRLLLWYRKRTRLNVSFLQIDGVFFKFSQNNYESHFGNKYFNNWI